MLLRFANIITVQTYFVGQPFPGLLYEVSEVKTKTGTMGAHAIVLMAGYYQVIFPGDQLQVQGGQCIGRVPFGYSPM